ncbi:tetratricopeptide repeat protein, partial [bacterium]|nr:tetratricopeptide repeat protein [bacterium]
EKPVDKEAEEKLRSLGYISTGSEERDRLAAADEKAGAKDNRNKEHRQDAPGSRTEALEPQKEMAPQEQNASKNEIGQAAGGALAPSTPPASVPAPVQQLEAKKMAKVPTFDDAQKQFQENNLNDGVNTSNVLIQQDKSQGRADYAVQFHEAGKRYQASQEPEQAIVQYNLVLNNYPGYTGSPDVLLRLAESYEQIGQYDQALKAYQQLAQIPAMKTTADRRISNMQKKQKTRDQLKSLGYTDQQKNN